MTKQERKERIRRLNLGSTERTRQEIALAKKPVKFSRSLCAEVLRINAEDYAIKLEELVKALRIVYNIDNRTQTTLQIAAMYLQRCAEELR